MGLPNFFILLRVVASLLLGVSCLANQIKKGAQNLESFIGDFLPPSLVISVYFSPFLDFCYLSQLCSFYCTSFRSYFSGFDQICILWKDACLFDLFN